MFIWRKNIPAKSQPRLSEILPYKRILSKNQNLFIWKYILSPNRDTTFIKPGSCFGGTFFPHINVSFHFAGTFSFIKCMCDIFKNYRKAFDKKCNRNGSQINELVEYQFTKILKYSIKKKMVHAVMKIIWAQKWR